jgi:hypothetical protein
MLRVPGRSSSVCLTEGKRRSGAMEGAEQEVGATDGGIEVNDKV